MGLLFALANGLNNEEFDVAQYQPSRFDRDIRSIAFYHNLAFIEKVPNREGSNLISAHPNHGRGLGAFGLVKERLLGRSIRDDWVGRALRRLRDRFKK